MAIAFPGGSSEYRVARDRLLEQEIELRRATEAVAAAQRRLPVGGIVPQDYVFQTRGPDGGHAGDDRPGPVAMVADRTAARYRPTG